MYGKIQSLGSLKSFLWHAPQPSGASILCFLILNPLTVHCQGWLQQFLDGRQNLFPSWVTSGLNFRVPAMWWLDDCNILSLLIRQVTFLVHTLFSSVCQSCPALCDPMDCSTPGFPVHHQLPELTQTYVHWVDDAIQPSHPVSSPSPPAFSLSQHQGLLQWVSSSHQVAKILEFHLQHQFFQWRFRTMNILSWIFTPCRSLTLKVEKIRTNLWSCLTKLHISLGIPP